MKIADIMTTIAVACSVAAVAMAGRREYRDSQMGREGNPASPPRVIRNWARYVEDGHRLGPPDAIVTLVEFGDFECPACAGFHRAISQMRARYPSKLAVIFRHFPLPYHKFARASAHAAECAGVQGRFEQYHDLLYARQDSLGLIPWSELARRADVRDVEAFSLCVDSDFGEDVIARDEAAARALEVGGTPGIIFDGKLFTGPPATAEIEAAIRLGNR